jgi:hypothetical protein
MEFENGFEDTGHNLISQQLVTSYLCSHHAVQNGQNWQIYQYTNILEVLSDVPAWAQSLKPAKPSCR